MLRRRLFYRMLSTGIAKDGMASYEVAGQNPAVMLGANQAASTTRFPGDPRSGADYEGARGHVADALVFSVGDGDDGANQVRHDKRQTINHAEQASYQCLARRQHAA